MFYRKRAGDKRFGKEQSDCMRITPSKPSGCSFGCLGAIVGTVLGSALLSHSTLDPDSTAWGMLFYGTFPGAIVGVIVGIVIARKQKR